jgi:hypothetical protein
MVVGRATTESRAGERSVDTRAAPGADEGSPVRESRRSVSRAGGSAVSVLPFAGRLRLDPSRSSTSNTMKEAIATLARESVAHQATAFKRAMTDLLVTLPWSLFAM